MAAATVLSALFERIQRAGQAAAAEPTGPAPSYEDGSLSTWGQSVEFLGDPRFREAHASALGSGQTWTRSGADLAWRVAICCWAGAHAARLPGDFVECGVHTGMFSLAVCSYTSFNDTGKRFWLFDTYSGIPDEQISPAERALGREDYASLYPDSFELVRKNFAPYPRAELVRGVVPASLDTVSIDQVAYLSIDMNIALPERAALEYFWPKLVPGAVVVLDDYGWEGHVEQKHALDDVARARGVEILCLPTGQGLLFK